MNSIDTKKAEELKAAQGKTSTTEPPVSTLARGLVDEKGNVVFTGTAPTTLAYAATVLLDFAWETLRSITLAGNITFSSANLIAGRSVTVRIIADGTNRTLAFPAGWKFVGAAAPTQILASKTAILTVTAFGTTDANAVAAYAEEV